MLKTHSTSGVTPKGLGGLGTSVLSGCPLWCPHRKGQDDTQVLIPKLPPHAGTAGPGTLLLSTSSLLDGAPCSTLSSPTSVWRARGKTGLLLVVLKHLHSSADLEVPQHPCGRAPSRVLCAALHTLGAHSCPRILVPAHFSQPQARPFFANTFQVQLGNRPNSSHVTLAAMAAEGTSLEPSLYPRTDLTPVSHEQPGQSLLPTSNPGTRIQSCARHVRHFPLAH